MDPLFKVEVVSQTPNPQQVIYAALHQDYAEGFVWDERDRFPDEDRAGEIAVRTLLGGNRGHFGCYSSDTEVMTDQGWVLWPNVTGEMKLLAVDPNTKDARFETPSNLQVFDFIEGEKMYEVKSQYLNMLVTQNHRMIVSRRKKDGSFTEWEAKTALDIYKAPVRYLLNCFLSESDRVAPLLPEGVDPLVAMKIAGFFFGDGLRSSNKKPGVIRFRLRRPRKIAYLMGLGLNVEPKKGDRYTVESKDLALWIHLNFSTPTGKTVPQWLITLPYNLLAAFWDGLKNSDGTRVTERSWAYDSCEKHALDIIQATAHLNGFSTNMTLNNPNVGEGHEDHNPCWRLCISETATRRVETCQKGRSPGVSESMVDYKGKVYCATVTTGALLVRREDKVVVSGNSLEHPQITLNCGWFPHSTMQQIRTHRIGVSFDVQSGRYSGKRIYDLGCKLTRSSKASYEVICGDINEIFYLRPVGTYTDRQGKKYEYTEDQRMSDLEYCGEAAIRYALRMDEGFSEEHARGLIPFDVRQHWVMSANVRSLMHLMDLRAKADAQLECVQLCELIWPHFEAWVPSIAAWYKKERWGKARLAP